MELKKDLLEMMGDHALTQLQKEFETQESLQAKVITALIADKRISRKRICEQFSLNEATFKKTLTIVKDILWDFNARHVTTPFDDAFVLRQLLFAGKIKTGLKYFTSLVKECELKQEWTKLDMLYIEGSRFAQITGDTQMALKITGERKKNMERLNTFTMLYSDIIAEMIKLEGYTIRKPNLANYASYLEGLHQQSLRTGHHLLIHTALHIRYLFYVRYHNDPQKVFEIISEQKNNVERYKYAMNAMTYAIALNNYVNFLIIYRKFESPEPYIKELKKIIHNGGKIAAINFYYSMLEYSLFEKKLKDVNTWLEELETLEDTSKFAQYKYIIFSIKAFIEKDAASFKDNFNRFYDESSHLDFPDLGITLRLLEIIIFIGKAEHDLAMARLDALRIYMSRNVDSGRHNDDRKLISLLMKINEGNKKVPAALNELEDSTYRNVAFIASAIKERLLK